MVTSYTLIPIVAIIFSGLTLQLVDIAQSASDKVLLQMQDYNLAIDCAFVGRPLVDCAPSLGLHNPRADLENLTATLKEITPAK